MRFYKPIPFILKNIHELLLCFALVLYGIDFDVRMGWPRSRQKQRCSTNA